jgi:8-oxo-dGTP pyrophosphatase MutT (NUDIX family)
LGILSGITESVQLVMRRPRRSQFAALCYRLVEGQAAPEILLLTSRGTGRWVIPKGWPMGSKPGHEVARQEALEEAGVVGVIEREPAGIYKYEKDMCDGYAVPCQVQVHALKVTSTVEDFKEKGQRKLDWVSAEVAERRVREPQLKRIIHHFAERFDPAAA